MSAAIFTDAEAMEHQARSLSDELDLSAGWEQHLRTEQRIEELREEAASIRARIKNSIEHIRNYYGIDLRVDLKVKHNGHAGHIVGFAGQYVVIQLDGGKYPMTCHATSDVEYPPGTQVGPGPDERFAHLVQV
ncbi:hypothetical protein KUF83_30430 [Streptomyces sp. BV286]|uniref:hypothetical protein n=1 Tax=Streptomyces sp. BV286 TaxID=2849672 RepID=UPI001C2E2512|nr:hypothetical protein [Streptomyces sp. BV286]MBV1940854.1 hypothetical protein [Streptomyces sp. BV286]